MESSFNSLKAIGSIAVASFSFLAMPLITTSVEATEEKSRFSSQLSPQKTYIARQEIEVANKDAAYIDNLREHYHLD